MGTTDSASREPWLTTLWECSHDPVVWLHDNVIVRSNPAARRELPELLEAGSDLSGVVTNGSQLTLTDRSGCSHTYQVRRCVPEPEASGELVIFRNITALHDLERSLLERTGQLQSTLESIPFDFWINDTENRTIHQSKASLELWGDHTGHHISEVTHNKKILARWTDTNGRALAGETVVGEISYAIDGRDRVFREIVAPVKAAGKIIGILGFNLEITDLKATLADRDALLKKLNHLVRNDLQIILSTVNLHLSVGRLSPEEILRHIERQIFAICLVHDQLYTGQPESTVNLSDFIVRLAPDAIVTDPSDKVLCDIELAIPIAILVTELLLCTDPPETRTLTHHRLGDDFHGDGFVIVTRQTGDRVTPEVTPDVTVVRGLVEQLAGTLTIENAPRLSITVTIPLEPA